MPQGCQRFGSRRHLIFGARVISGYMCLSLGRESRIGEVWRGRLISIIVRLEDVDERNGILKFRQLDVNDLHM